MLTTPRSLLLATFGVAAILLLALGVPGTPTKTVQAGPHIDPEVVTYVNLLGKTRVLVTLQEPSGVAGLAPRSATARTALRAQKDDVLAGIPASEFTPNWEYSALPVLSGTIDKAGLAALSVQPDVKSIDVDGVGSIALEQTLPLIHAQEVHSAGVTGEGVVVAVLDTGADIDHPDLADDILYQECFLSRGGCDPENPGNDDHGHGTNVAGIITSDGTVAPLGVAPDAKIAVYKVLSSSGFGLFSDWIAALNDIIANHPEVNVINMSLQSRDHCPSSALSTAIGTLRDMGVATFIASGNHGDKSGLTIPACVDEAISVGAVYDSNLGSVDGWKSNCTDETTHADQVACWSDSDPSLDLLAPGARVTSTGIGGGTSTYMGTSQASPHAAGVAALLFQAFPNLTVDQLEARMKSSGTLITDDLHDNDPSTNRTTPRIDARVALLSPGEDTDGDGCTNGEEFGTDPRLGGQRNPLNPWDFHDVNGDGTITLFDDILPVINGFGSAGNDPSIDRSPAPPASQPWRQGPPDGTIDLANDIMGAAAQFGHHCEGATP